MEDITKLSTIEVERYLRLLGKKGTQVISALGKLYPFINSILETEVGKELLKYDIVRADELLEKIYKEIATSQELAEYRYLRDERFPMILGKLNSYLKRVEEVKKSNNIIKTI